VFAKFDSEVIYLFMDRKGEKQSDFVDKSNHAGVDNHCDFDAFGYFARYYAKLKQVTEKLRLAHDCFA
jgi:hypothetical protein